MFLLFLASSAPSRCKPILCTSHPLNLSVAKWEWNSRILACMRDLTEQGIQRAKQLEQQFGKELDKGKNFLININKPN